MPDPQKPSVYAVKLELRDCVAVALPILVWQLAFPHVFWFLKFWSGGVTGIVVALFLRLRWPSKTDTFSQLPWREKLVPIFSVCLFAGIAIFREVPSMVFQERERSFWRGISAAGIQQIEIRPGAGPGVTLTDGAGLNRFCDLSGGAELFYPSHEGSLQEFEFALVWKDGVTIERPARIPEHHPHDLALDFVAAGVHHEILIPQASDWVAAVLSPENR